jgi:hypothetical protein
MEYGFTAAPTGNLPEILRPDNVAEAEFEWVNKYGTAVRIKGAYGVCII